jgi:hypothetical protein
VRICTGAGTVQSWIRSPSPPEMELPVLEECPAADEFLTIFRGEPESTPLLSASDVDDLDSILELLGYDQKDAPMEADDGRTDNDFVDDCKYPAVELLGSPPDVYPSREYGTRRRCGPRN